MGCAFESIFWSVCGGECSWSLLVVNMFVYIVVGDEKSEIF